MHSFGMPVWQAMRLMGALVQPDTAQLCIPDSYAIDGIYDR